MVEPSGQLAAIVAGGCGLGRVVLCGMHVEASAKPLLVEQYGGVAKGAWPASWRSSCSEASSDIYWHKRDVE